MDCVPHIDRLPLTRQMIWLRENLENFVVAILMALTIRHYVIEPFQIPTGSMATTLLGQHAMVLCPQCRWEFPRGMSSQTGQIPRVHKCPHCLQVIDVKDKDMQRWGGEKILADKFTFRLMSPDRYDTVVFRPPGQYVNYIKRAVSLGGETIFLLQGDLWVRKEIGDQRYLAPKPKEVQDQVWLPVYDMAHDIKATTFFELGEGWARNSDEKGKTQAYSFKNKSGKAKLVWKRQGKKQIKDEISYNAENYKGGRKIVGDLKIEGEYLLSDHKKGEFTLHMTDGDLNFEINIGKKNQIVCYGKNKNKKFSFGKRMSTLTNNKAVNFVFQNWDDQIILEINGETVVAQSSVTDLRTNMEKVGYHDQDGFSFSVSGADAEVNAIKVWRDIYYSGGKNGMDYFWEVPEGHFFAMGDNTNNSQDSRGPKFSFIPLQRIQGRPWLHSIHWDVSKPFSPHRDWRVGRVY